jgi:putative endonuclease
MYEHKHKLTSGFARKYNLTMLVYFEETPDILAALAREKQIEGWTRDKKLDLIEANNPTWRDLSADF